MATKSVLIALVSVLALMGCEGAEVSDDDFVDSAPSESPPVDRWAKSLDREHDRYLDRAGAIEPKLGREGVGDIGLDLCRAMFALRTDEELIAIARRRAASETEADLSADQAVRLIVLTNNLICPDLQR